MKKTLIFIAITVALFSLSFSGCTPLPTPGELIRPPAVKTSIDLQDNTASLEEIKRIAQQFLPSGASFLAPMQADEKIAENKEFVRAVDLNQDGRPEIVAGYRVSQGHAGVMVLQRKESWEKVWFEEGKGYALERVQPADITGDGQDELLVGWAIGASAGNGLDILAWREKSLQKIAGTAYHRLETEDLAGEYGKDGKQELAIWNKDTGDAFAVEVLRWNGLKLAPAEDAYLAYFPKVVEYYQEKIKKFPQARFYWYYLADALIKVKNYPEALLAIKKGMALESEFYPSKYSFQLLKGQVCLGLGHYQEALTVYQEITKLGQDLKPEQGYIPGKTFSSRGSTASLPLPYDLSFYMLAQAYYGSGEAYLGIGKKDLAKEHFQKALTWAPDWDKPQKALARLPLQEISEKIYDYWAGTKPEYFEAKWQNFKNWVKEQKLPGEKELTLFCLTAQGHQPADIPYLFFIDWGVEKGFTNTMQAHGIYWLENGRLKSQVFYSLDAASHGLDQSRAAWQARMALKIDAQGHRYPELGVVYDGAFGGSGSPRPVFYLWRLKESGWQVLWRSDESLKWRNSHGELNFVGLGLEEFTLKNDSWGVGDGKDEIFHESNPGPHRYFLDTWQRVNDHYELKEARTLPSAYNTLVELVYCLSTGKEKGAEKLVTSVSLLGQAKRYGLVQKPLGQRWSLTFKEALAEQTGPFTITSGPAAGVTVEFTQRNGQWLVGKIYRNKAGGK